MAHCAAANDVWCIDFKGWFVTGDGARCEPLTLSDAHSRYLLRCQAMARTDADHVWPVLDAAFREFGLPYRLRSDNGPPFASCGAGGLSQLSVKVIKAGVVPERIAPGKPQQNGRLERLHLTLLHDTADPPARSLREQLERLRSFQRLYNDERPHQALGNDTPAEHYVVSPRRFDGVLREPSYRRRPRGPARAPQRRDQMAGPARSTSAARLIGEPVGLIENNDGGWTVCLRPDRARRHRPWPRPSAQTQTRTPVDLWILRQQRLHLLLVDPFDQLIDQAAQRHRNFRGLR